MTPIVLDLLAAARIERLAGTGQCNLIGVFHALTLKLPASVAFGVYFSLTGFHGPVELAVECLDPADQRLASGPVRIGDRDPLSVATGMALFANVTIARSGTYRLRVTGEGRVLAERPIIIRAA